MNIADSRTVPESPVPAAEPGPRPSGPLAGIRILDMATVIAAPFGATLCADWGAEVVKLELPDGSDPLRSLLPVRDGVPLHWKVTNRGKKGISLDVRTQEGRELFLRLLPDFDVLVENFRPGTLARWGLDIDTLHRVNPRLVVLRLTGFGQTGPMSAAPGFARIFEAMSGFTALSGERGGSPLHMNYPIGDLVAGVFAAFAIAAAMVRVRGNAAPRGCEIDLAATEALLRILDPLPVEHELCGTIRGPAGNRASYTAPSNMYRSRDGAHVSLVASSDAIWRRLCTEIGRPELIEDQRLASIALRVRHADLIDAAIGDWFARHDADAAITILQAAGVPCSRVQSIADIVRDPHFLARQAIERLEDPELGSLPAPCVVPRIVGEPMPPPRTGPAIGEHNAEVFGRIGLAAADLQRLRDTGVI
jgi:crotonobetainyl-CoA:carnitine CoA-transferase CaiB-like acyl-CoA transferase